MSKVFLFSSFTAALITPFTSLMANELSSERLSSSFQNQTFLSAPSLIKSFNQQDLKALAVTDLYHLLNFVPGIQVTTGEHNGPSKSIQARGVTSNGNHIAVIVDGIKMNDIILGESTKLLSALDLSLIDSVEIHRGANGAKFGNGAMLATIVVKTKVNNAINVQAGKYNQQSLSANANRKLLNGLATLNMALAKNNGETFESQRLDSNLDIEQGSIAKPSNTKLFNLAWTNQAVTARYLFTESESNKFLNGRGYSNRNKQKHTSQAAQISYQSQLDQQVSLKANVDYKDQSLKALGFMQPGFSTPFSEDFYFGPNWTSSDLTASLSVYNNWSKSFQFGFGIDWSQASQNRTGAVTTHISDDLQTVLPVDAYYLGNAKSYDSLGSYDDMNTSLESKSFFFESRYKFDQNSDIHLGGRYHDLGELGNVFSPQISVLRHLGQNHHLRVNYSHGYRTPLNSERYINDFLTLGNDQLQIEQLQNIEVNYNIVTAQMHLELTAFANEIEQRIMPREIEDGDRVQYMHDKTETVTGIETQIEYNLAANHKVQAGYTHYLTDTLDNSFDHFASFQYRGSYQQLSFSLNYVFRPESTVKNADVMQGNQPVIFSEKAVQLVDVKVAYQLGRAIELGVSATNVLDKQYKTYEGNQDLHGYSVVEPGLNTRVFINYQF